MLPKPIYESLPYINLVIGCGIVLKYPSVLITLGGVLVFLVGALMWVMRSDHRREDQAVRLRGYGSLNRRLYELKPFFYMLFALLVVNRVDSPVLAMAGLLIGAYGLMLLIKRSLHRHLSA